MQHRLHQHVFGTVDVSVPGGLAAVCTAFTGSAVEHLVNFDGYRSGCLFAIFCSCCKRFHVAQPTMTSMAHDGSPELVYEHQVYVSTLVECSFDVF